MVRLRNIHTGAVVSVRDEKADRLGAEWGPVTPDPTPEPVRAKRAPRAASPAPTK